MSSSLLFLMKLSFLLMVVMSLAQPLHDSPPPSPHTQSCEEEAELLKTPPSDSHPTHLSNSKPQPQTQTLSSSDIEHKPLSFASSNTKPSESDSETSQPPQIISEPHEPLSFASSNTKPFQSDFETPQPPQIISEPHQPLSFGSSNTKPFQSDSENPQPPQIISETHTSKNTFLPPQRRLLVDEQKPCGARAFYKEGSCFCKEGYRGDPYIGCVDIDECMEIGCATPARCTNLVGSYHCRCPFPYDGDGKLDGTGCTFRYQKKVDKIIRFMITAAIVFIGLQLYGNPWGERREERRD